MNKKMLVLNLIFLLFIGNGCDHRSPQSVHSEKSSAEDSVKLDKSVDQINEEGLQELIQNRNGKILLLNIWATWCQPCVEEFPNLIRLYSVYDTNSLEIVGVSADDMDERDSKVLPFIKRNKVPFKIYIAHFNKQDDFINSLNETWNGAIPATFYYDINGKQIFMEIGAKTFEQFKQKVEQMKSVSIRPG